MLGITKNRELNKEPSEDKTSRKCGKTGHTASRCLASSGDTRSHSTREVKSSTEVCPACISTHTYKGFRGQDTPSFRLSHCKTFREKPIQERANQVAELKCCTLCLDWRGTHMAKGCQAKKEGKLLENCKEQDGNKICGKPHHE